MASKKRKIDLENRQFNGEWTEDYLFVLNPSNKPKCLLCDCTLSMIKSQNIKRHFFTHHKHFNEKYKPGSWARKQKVACLDKSASSQKQCLSTFVSEQSKATEATLSISHILGKRMMTYSDAEAVKECIVEAVKIMHPSKKEVITSMTTLPLSRLTCTRRCTDIAEDLHDQVLIEVKDADCYALALDESTDITNCAQLAVFVRYFHHGVFNEELLALITLHGNTTAAAIYDALISKLKELQLPIQNICALSTDGAPAMIGACHGVVTNLRTEYCPDLIGIHCIIHQSVLCAKLSGDFQELMTDAMKLINKLKANSSLKHRQLRNFLDQHNAEFCDLLTHNNVRWLSKGNALKRLWDLRKDLVMFLNEKGQTSTLLEGTNLCNLAFLADCFTHLNTLNLKLQGKRHTIIQLWSAVKSFKQQLLLFVSDITKDMLHFPCLKVTIQEVSCDNDWSCFVEFLENWDTEFCNRFKEFYEISSVIELISHPLSADVDGTWKTQLFTEYALLVSKMQNVSDAQSQIDSLKIQVVALEKMNAELDGKEMSYLMQIREGAQLLDDALLARDSALVREKQKQEDLEKTSAALETIVQEVADRVKSEVGKIKAQCNERMRRLTEEVEALELEATNLKSEADRAKRAKRTVEEELDALSRQRHDKNDRSQTEDLQRRTLNAERARDDAFITIQTLEDKLKRLEMEHDDNRLCLLSVNQTQEQRIKRLQRETEECQHERLHLLESINQYKHDNQKLEEMTRSARVNAEKEFATKKDALEREKKQLEVRLKSMDETNRESIQQLHQMLANQQRITARWKEESKSAHEKYEDKIKDLQCQLSQHRRRCQDLTNKMKLSSDEAKLNDPRMSSLEENNRQLRARLHETQYKLLSATQKLGGVQPLWNSLSLHDL